MLEHRSLDGVVVLPKDAVDAKAFSQILDDVFADPAQVRAFQARVWLVCRNVAHPPH
jgi:hypothetical protein